MTDGALEAHARGIATACSLVASGADFARAASLLRGVPGLEVGVHLALSGARAVCDPGEIPSLAPGGELPATHAAFLSRWMARRIDPRDVGRELRRQVERVREAGLAPSRIDGHQHLHVLPGIAAAVARLALDHAIPYVRVPVWGRSLASPRGVALSALDALARGARGTLRRAGVVTNDRAIGVLRAGHLTRAGIAAELAKVEGVTELVAHPGVGNARIASRYRWGYDWDAERAALTDASLRDEIARRGIRLVTAREALG